MADTALGILRKLYEAEVFIVNMGGYLVANGHEETDDGGTGTISIDLTPEEMEVALKLVFPGKTVVWHK